MHVYNLGTKILLLPLEQVDDSTFPTEEGWHEVIRVYDGGVNAGFTQSCAIDLEGIGGVVHAKVFDHRFVQELREDLGMSTPYSYEALRTAITSESAMQKIHYMNDNFMKIIASIKRQTQYNKMFPTASGRLSIKVPADYTAKNTISDILNLLLWMHGKVDEADHCQVVEIVTMDTCAVRAGSKLEDLNFPMDIGNVELLVLIKVIGDFYKQWDIMTHLRLHRSSWFPALLSTCFVVTDFPDGSGVHISPCILNCYQAGITSQKLIQSAVLTNDFETFDNAIKALQVASHNATVDGMAITDQNLDNWIIDCDPKSGQLKALYVDAGGLKISTQSVHSHTNPTDPSLPLLRSVTGSFAGQPLCFYAKILRCHALFGNTEYICTSILSHLVALTLSEEIWTFDHPETAKELSPWANEIVKLTWRMIAPADSISDDASRLAVRLVLFQKIIQPNIQDHKKLYKNYVLLIEEIRAAHIDGEERSAGDGPKLLCQDAWRQQATISSSQAGHGIGSIPFKRWLQGLERRVRSEANIGIETFRQEDFACQSSDLICKPQYLVSDLNADRARISTAMSNY